MLNLTGAGNNATVFLDPVVGTKLAAAPATN
jgi:phospholipase C